MSASVDATTYSKDRPFLARIVENRLLNQPGSAKETRHFAVNLAGSGLHYKAGDSLGVFGENRASEVSEILSRLGATGEELVSPVMLKLPAPIPVREALRNRLALAGPTKKIVETLAAKATQADEKSRLDGLLLPESKEVLASYLEAREFVDLLAEFPSAKLTPQELVDHMRRLMPRLYSIASSPKLYPEEIHLTVAVVRYETNHRDRVGVCTTFLADRVQLGVTPAPVFVSHSHFGLPDDGTKDVIMVGPGTGIAPFRAFMQDRVASGASGRNWVFYGDQHRAMDFLYEEEWTAWQAQGRLARLDTAFSRDQTLKVYVQDRMRENAAELWSWIKGGAYFYVCGDAKRMAKDVDTALLEVIAQQGGMEAAAAAEVIKQLKKDKRYQRDVY
ncbi:MAG: sulfite reductase (NADPH) flavoprotein alpha-component [Verrucomicrobia bacterium]|jgi:sulfite reductase (NADPH) flavoprotein alpha-component|nr:MAG: sulfite reductase (NADPH) flavoprotein alpha-component [Verrucomicrobiota bacterium]